MTAATVLSPGQRAAGRFQVPSSHLPPAVSRIDGRDWTPREMHALRVHARLERARLIRIGAIRPGPADLSHIPEWVTSGPCLLLDAAAEISARVDMAADHVERASRPWGLS